MKDRAFFEVVTRLLHGRHTYHPTLWSYGILHADLHFGPDVRFFTQVLSALEQVCTRIIPAAPMAACGMNSWDGSLKPGSNPYHDPVLRTTKAPHVRGFRFMRRRGLEPPRAIQPTRPSTLRVYQFRHRRSGRAEYSPA